MNSPAPRSPRSRSQAGGRRPARPPSHLHSDCPPDDDDSPSLGQRSASLTTLQPTIAQPRMAQLETLEAKMASIEVSLSSTPRRKKNGTLNASIRSIPKEIAVKELESLRNALRDKENIIQSLMGQLTIPGLRLAQIRNHNNNNGTTNNRELSEIEKKQAEERLSRLRNDTDNKRLAIKNLKMALERLDITDNIDVRIQQAELEYQLGREELNLLTLLEETRALQLCLEESNKNTSDLNTLYSYKFIEAVLHLERSLNDAKGRGIPTKKQSTYRMLDSNDLAGMSYDFAVLYSCVAGEEVVTLRAIEVTYDPKSPRFGAGQKDSNLGLWIDWALEDTGICKGDRLVEVNGKIVLTKTRDDLARLLAAAPDPAQIVVLRKNTGKSQNTEVVQTTTTSNGGAKEVQALRSELEVVRERAEEAQRVKDGLRSDNIRLTHRISYLEEQVSELLSRRNSESDIRIVAQSPVITSTVKTNQNVTNINISSQATTVANNDLQVFQKGPQVTALVANLPGLEISKDNHTSLPVRSKSSLSNVSNTHIPAPSPQPSDNSCHKNHRQKHHRNSRNGLQLTNGLDQNYSKKHHHHHHYVNRERDYSSETNSTVEQPRSRRPVENGHYHKPATAERDSSEQSLMEQSFKKATKIVYDLTKHKEANLYEKHRQKCLTASEKYNADLLRHYNARKSTSVLDFRSEVHIGPKYDSRSIETLDGIDTSTTTTSTNGGKRLYKKLQDVRSVKSLDFDSDCNSYRNANQNNIDYTSEPIEGGGSKKQLPNYHHNMYSEKPRPTPPKKPIRLSLHRAQSVQSVETPAESPAGSPDKNDPRKPLKRNYKGEVPPVSLLTVKVEKSPDRKQNGTARIDEQYHQPGKKHNEVKWTSFGQAHHKHDNGFSQHAIENGSWC